MNGFGDTSTQIFNTIKSSRRVLLHCHPFPDPDSICSVLAMSLALKGLGKEVLAISGDSPYPENLPSIPNKDILKGIRYSEVNLSNIDLFIILDSSSQTQISQEVNVVFPASLKTVVIDHHKTNSGFGGINLVLPDKSSTCEILYELFKSWQIMITAEMAVLLFIGIYADTHGFKYPNSSPQTLAIATELAGLYPSYHQFVFELENNKKPLELEMLSLALGSLEKFYSGAVVLSSIPYNEIRLRGLSKYDAMEGLVADTLRSVVGWNIVASMVEAEPGVTTVSLRTRQEKVFDVSLVARSVGRGGGGHRGAAGTTIHSDIREAKNILLKAIGEVFPMLGSQ